jgi:hypothetical protein
VQISFEYPLLTSSGFLISVLEPENMRYFEKEFGKGKFEQPLLLALVISPIWLLGGSAIYKETISKGEILNVSGLINDLQTSSSSHVIALGIIFS